MSRNKLNVNRSFSNLLADPMVIDVDMLCTSMEDIGFLGEVEGALVVATKESRVGERSREFGNEIPEPNELPRRVGRGDVFSFG